MRKNKSLFVSFEGPEASGKSSQIILLKNFLIKNKIPYIVTREPGGTIISEKLRNIILQKKNNITNLEEILLLMAARLNHINQIIVPNLKKGKLVISDRFADSTFVYQGFVNGFGIKKIQKLHKDLLNNFLPTKTFLFKLPSNEIIKRLNKRKIKNKYDIKDIKFHNNIALGYKQISNNKRFTLINGLMSKDKIHKKILKTLGL